MNNEIQVEVLIAAPVEKAWEYWTSPEHIKNWCFASEDWHAPEASNDLRVGGRFRTRMESKDGQAGFDFGGAYTALVEHERIEYTMDDGRKVKVIFSKEVSGCKVMESFEPENENPPEMQKKGWQSILENFKKYVESR